MYELGLIATYRYLLSASSIGPNPGGYRTVCPSMRQATWRRGQITRRAPRKETSPWSTRSVNKNTRKFSETKVRRKSIIFILWLTKRQRAKKDQSGNIRKLTFPTLLTPLQMQRYTRIQQMTLHQNTGHTMLPIWLILGDIRKRRMLETWRKYNEETYKYRIQ